jgi:hypothetical protein
MSGRPPTVKSYTKSSCWWGALAGPQNTLPILAVTQKVPNEATDVAKAAWTYGHGIPKVSLGPTMADPS